MWQVTRKGLAVLAVAVVMVVLFEYYYYFINIQYISTYFRYPSSLDVARRFDPLPIRVHYYNKPEYIPRDVFKSCQHKCFLTWGKDSYRDSKIVIFHGPRLGPSSIPPKKMHSQIWVLHSKESPSNYNTRFTQWKWMFNWTMTYQRDADILAINGAFKKILDPKNTSQQTSTEPTLPGRLFRSGIGDEWKSKMHKTAWFVSNCKTPGKREQFVKLLSKYVEVDIYGRCGKFKCSRSNEKLCMEILRKKYKLYLSFENSLCRDYITEKSYKVYNKLVNTVPVTRGIGDQYSLFLPPESYINTNDFNSTKALGMYLNKVMKMPVHYFNWRQHYVSFRPFPYEFCDLCRKMHEGHEKYKRLYQDVGSFLNGGTYKSYCLKPRDIK